MSLKITWKPSTSYWHVWTALLSDICHNFYLFLLKLVSLFMNSVKSRWLKHRPVYLYFYPKYNNYNYRVIIFDINTIIKVDYSCRKYLLWIIPKLLTVVLLCSLPLHFSSPDVHKCMSMTRTFYHDRTRNSASTCKIHTASADSLL